MPLNITPLVAVGLHVSEDDIETIFNETLAAVVPPYPSLDARQVWGGET